jgi:hypothetical protein
MKTSLPKKTLDVQRSAKLIFIPRGVLLRQEGLTVNQAKFSMADLQQRSKPLG